MGRNLYVWGVHRYGMAGLIKQPVVLLLGGAYSRFEVTRLTDCVYIDGQLPVIYQVSLT